MRRRLLVVLVWGVAVLAGMAGAQNWPSFRGPRAAGVAEGYALPLKWSVAEGRNILWRTPIPGLGHSSPVVWEDRIFVTTAVDPEGESPLKPGLYGDVKPLEEDKVFAFRLYCLDRRSGEVLWHRTCHEGKPEVKRHPKSSHANPTPCTDGKRVVASFFSEGVYCYDMEGELQWQKDFGVLDAGFFRMPQAQWGGASSPVIAGELLILQCDVQGDSFLGAFELADGSPVWRVARDEVPTWSTPTICPAPGGAQVVVNGFRHIGGYDLATGRPVWRLRGGGDIPVPTPVAAGGLVFITNAHGGQSPLYAVSLKAKGDVTPTGDPPGHEHLAWHLLRGGNYMPTPIVYRGLLYTGADSGRLTCYDAATGERHYRVRLGETFIPFSASPVAGEGRLYFPSEKGTVFVVRAGKDYELLAANDLGGTCMATPALSRGRIYFRTRSHLVAVGKEKGGQAEGEEKAAQKGKEKEKEKEKGEEKPALPTLGRATVRIENLAVPESFAADPEKGHLYIANINGSPMAKDGNGFITRLSPAGKVLELEWAGRREGGGGLDAPKGMAFREGILYVTDIDRVRRFRLGEKAEALPPFPVAGARFLNDPAAGAEELYVSDSFGDRVYRLDRETGAVKGAIPVPGRPNGLCLVGDTLYCVTMGGGIFRVDLAGSEPAPEEITPAQPKLAGLDGLAALPGGGFLISGHGPGIIWHFRDGVATRLAEGLTTPADIGLDREGGRVLIPLFRGAAAEIRPLE